MERSFNVMMNSKTRQKKKVCTVFICPKELSAIGVFEMKKRKKAYDLGYQAAVENCDDLLALKNR